MGTTITSTLGYYGLKAWILANVVQLATFKYCDRFVTFHRDPTGRQRDQMNQAARSITANIAEGYSRHQTSLESEMRLLDVARASVSELHGDYHMAIMHYCGAYPWQASSPEAQAVEAVSIDAPVYTSNDYDYESSVQIFSQLDKFGQWLNSDYQYIVSNALLILTKRLTLMIQKLLKQRLEYFKQNGGFTENMSAARYEAIREKAKQQAVDKQAPICPKCGGPMRQRFAKKGSYQGPFWSCCDFPRCNGTRDIRDVPSPA